MKRGDGWREAWAWLLQVRAAVGERIERALRAESGLDLSEFEVLQRLAASGEGHMRMQELARAVLLTKSGITRVVDRLEARGLVERVPCPQDRRAIWARITAKGRAVLERARPAHDRVVSEALGERLEPEEMDTLVGLLSKVGSGLGLAADAVCAGRVGQSPRAGQSRREEEEEGRAGEEGARSLPGRILRGLLRSGARPRS